MPVNLQGKRWPVWWLGLCVVCVPGGGDCSASAVLHCCTRHLHLVSVCVTHTDTGSRCALAARNSSVCCAAIGKLPVALLLHQPTGHPHPPLTTATVPAVGVGAVWRLCACHCGVRSRNPGNVTVCV